MLLIMHIPRCYFWSGNRKITGLQTQLTIQMVIFQSAKGLMEHCLCEQKGKILEVCSKCKSVDLHVHFLLVFVGFMKSDEHFWIHCRTNSHIQ